MLFDRRKNSDISKGKGCIQISMVILQSVVNGTWEPYLWTKQKQNFCSFRLNMISELFCNRNPWRPKAEIHLSQTNPAGSKAQKI